MKNYRSNKFQKVVQTNQKKATLNDDIIDVLSKISLITNKDAKNHNMKNAIIYTRVSTSLQTDGTSLQSQLQICSDYCRKNKMSVLKVVEKVGSAFKSDSLFELELDLLKHKYINLIIVEPSRLSRNLANFTNFINFCTEHHILIHFVEGQMLSNNTHDMKKIISCVYAGQIESENIGSRIKRSIAFRKLNGTYCTRAKYGYKFSRNLNTKMNILKFDPSEQNTIKLIQKLYYGSDTKTILDLMFKITDTNHEIIDQQTNQNVSRIDYGNMSMKMIADFLNSNFIFRRGKNWSQNSIRNILLT